MMEVPQPPGFEGYAGSMKHRLKRCEQGCLQSPERRKRKTHPSGKQIARHHQGRPTMDETAVPAYIFLNV
jgi:hypothetical protein